MSEAFVQIRDISRDFDVSKPFLNRILQMEGRKILTAVDKVSFDIPRGSTFALVGESGSGKSTVGRMLVGLLPPSNGHILIDGIDLATASDSESTRLRQRIQMIFQDPYASLNPRWRVREIISEPYAAFNNPTAGEIDKHVDALLERVGLQSPDATKYPHEFSGGQRQRIGIARAISSGPELIVCDEPTSALDVSVQAQVLNLMRDLQKDLGLTYLFITHDLAVVRYMANQIGVLYLGQIIESGPQDQIFRNPRHPYTKMLLDAAPSIQSFDRTHESVKGEIPDPINRPSGCHFHPRCSYAEARCKESFPAERRSGQSSVRCHVDLV